MCRIEVQGERDELQVTVQSLQESAINIASLTSTQNELSDELERVLAANVEIQRKAEEDEQRKTALQAEVDQLRQQVTDLQKAKAELESEVETVREEKEVVTRNYTEITQTSQTSLLTISQQELTIQSLNVGWTNDYEGEGERRDCKHNHI